MKILIYSYNYHPEPIGIAPLMTELAEGLVTRGHEVRVITAMPNYPERQIYDDYKGKWYLTEERNGVTIQRSVVWIRPRPNLFDRLLLDGTFVFNSLPQALSRWRPDVVLATVPPLPICIPVTILSWLRQTPVVLNIQDIQHEAAWEVGLLKNKLLFKAFASLEKFACRKANKISVIADGFTENLVKKGVPMEKIVLIPNWVNVNFIRPIQAKKNSFRDTYQLQGKFVVLYSGNIALTQQLPTAIKAAAQLGDIPDIVFVIVGETKAIQRVKEYCEMFSAHNVKLLTFQPREKLPEMLAAADVGLVVQKHNVIGFNMPSKIPVLLASGCPIAASVPLTGTAAKAIQKSGGGVVVPPENEQALADAILDLYNHPEKRRTLSEKARQYAIENYSYEQALNRYESLFSELLAENAYRVKALSK